MKSNDTELHMEVKDLKQNLETYKKEKLQEIRNLK